MKIVGLSGMPKSGKGEASQVLMQRGYAHITMSDLLRQKIMADTGMLSEDISRDVMLNSARQYRLQEPGMLARLSMEEAMKLPPDTKGVIIDGIRNPAEIDTLIHLCCDHGHDLHFLGIRVSDNFEEDCRIRYERLQANYHQRGQHYDPPDWDHFVENSRLEWDDESPAGIHVNTCLDIIRQLKNGTILNNGSDKDLHSWHDEIVRFANGLENHQRHPERKP